MQPRHIPIGVSVWKLDRRIGDAVKYLLGDPGSTKH